MGRNILIVVFCMLFIPDKSWAQEDPWSGTWQMIYLPNTGMVPIQLTLQISTPEKSILYPAHILLQCDTFVGEYELLLVKKNSRELGISRNKFPVSEKPFSLGSWPALLNGSFDISKDAKGIPILTAMRIQSKQLVEVKPDSLHITGAHQKTASHLKEFLKDADIRLSKVNNIPWDNERRDLILIPGMSPAYFGLQDTIYLPKRDGIGNLLVNKKRESDKVSITLNGQVIVDQLELYKKNHEEEILLSPGLNILTLFADNFGNALPNTGKLQLEFGNKKFALDFTNKRDSAATFIVAKLLCEPDQSKGKSFPDNNNPGDARTLQKNEKLLGSIISTSANLTFAIWDDMVEDGDSISINIDGKWLVRGCPVKKKPTFISIKLKPGPNNISFIGDNLGSIPPNTSVLEIIDGKKRKFYTMEANLGEKNIVRIFYDSRTGL